MKEERTSSVGDAVAGSARLAEGTVLQRSLQGDADQRYFVYLPGLLAPEAPVFVGVHDISRNAREMVASFAPVGERYGAVLVAPLFAQDRFPNYQRLGRDRRPTGESRMADEILEEILSEVGSATGVAVDRFHLFGYAAGGRFAMRYAMLHPERVEGAVLAAPGTYTFPDPEKRFPQGIAPGRKRTDLVFEPDRFLRVPMVLLDSRTAEEADDAPRLERVDAARDDLDRDGRAWVAAMAVAAEKLGLQSLVSQHEVDGSADSFEVLLEEANLPERVLEALLGAAPGDEPKFFIGATQHASSGPSRVAAESRPTEDEETQDDVPSNARRIALKSLLALGIIALMAPVFLWVHYRSTHVMSRQAAVRGPIAEIGARLDGAVASVEVNPGDRVRAGQVVARLEDRQLQAKVRQARSQLEKATRELEVERLAIINERQRLEGALREVSAGLAAARAEMAASESQADEALRRLELQQTLSKQGLVAQERVRTAETEVRTARAFADAARAEQRAAIAGRDLAVTTSEGLAVREKRVSVLESEISSLRAELAAAEANLADTVIRAPDDGAVVRRIVEPGGAAVVGQPILSLWIGGETWVEAWIDEDDLGELAVGNRATVTFKSYPDREFTGFVESLGVSTDFELPDSEVPQARRDRMRDAPVISARIRLEDSDIELFPGLSAVVAIQKQAD